MKKFTAILVILSFAFMVSGCELKLKLKEPNKGQMMKEHNEKNNPGKGNKKK